MVHFNMEKCICNMQQISGVITASWTFAKGAWKKHLKYFFTEAFRLWLLYVFNIDVEIVYAQLKAYCSQRTLEYSDGGNPIKEDTWQHLISVHASLI